MRFFKSPIAKRMLSSNTENRNTENENYEVESNIESDND